MDSYYGVSGVYLLHFDNPVSKEHTCQHYLGYASCIGSRLDAHRRGSGARLVEVAQGRGIGFSLARVWVGEGRAFERRLKNQHSGRRLCPVCRS